jgi:hypothetical protein
MKGDDLKGDETRRVLRYLFDAGSGVCLWSGDEATREWYGLAVSPEQLPLAKATRREVERLVSGYDTALDWDDPAGPTPWSAEECADFNAAARVLLARLRAELDAFTIVDCFRAVTREEGEEK